MDTNTTGNVCKNAKTFWLTTWTHTKRFLKLFPNSLQW